MITTLCSQISAMFIISSSLCWRRPHPRPSKAKYRVTYIWKLRGCGLRNEVWSFRLFSKKPIIQNNIYLLLSCRGLTKITSAGGCSSFKSDSSTKTSPVIQSICYPFTWVQKRHTVLKRCLEAPHTTNWPQGIIYSGTMCPQIKHVRF